MSKVDVIRAWKDEDYRLSLSDDERALLPEYPAGMGNLSDIDLEGVGGGKLSTEYILTLVLQREI